MHRLTLALSLGRFVLYRAITSSAKPASTRGSSWGPPRVQTAERTRSQTTSLKALELESNSSSLCAAMQRNENLQVEGFQALIKTSKSRHHLINDASEVLRNRRITGTRIVQRSLVVATLLHKAALIASSRSKSSASSVLSTPRTPRCFVLKESYGFDQVEAHYSNEELLSS